MTKRGFPVSPALLAWLNLVECDAVGVLTVARTNEALEAAIAILQEELTNRLGAAQWETWYQVQGGRAMTNGALSVWIVNQFPRLNPGQLKALARAVLNDLDEDEQIEVLDEVLHESTKRELEAHWGNQ